MKFSIVIPVFNVAPYLWRCLESVAASADAAAASHGAAFEVLCVDDGSTDGSGGILDAFAARDPRFKVSHRPNGGVSAARNAALDTATGDWVGFVDADDTISPLWFPTATALVSQSPDADIVRIDGLVPVLPPFPPASASSPSPDGQTVFGLQRPADEEPPVCANRPVGAVLQTAPSSPAAPSTSPDGQTAFGRRGPGGEEPPASPNRPVGAVLQTAPSPPAAHVLSGGAAQRWAISTYSRYGWTVLSFVRRAFLGPTRFAPNVPLKEDVLFFLDLSSRVSRIAYARFPGYFYTVREGSALHGDRNSTAQRIAFLSRLRRFGPELRGAASRCAGWDLVQWIAERESLATAGRPMPPESERSMLDAWRGLVDGGVVDVRSIFPYWRPGVRRWLKSGDPSPLAATRKLRMLFGDSPRDPFAANPRQGRSPAIDCIKAVAAILVICCHVFDSRAQAGVGGRLMPALWGICYFSSVPLFAAVCGWLSHRQDLVTYYAKKFIRILVPFFIFSALKIFYSVAISSSYAHADTLPGMLFDAFILGRLYWFAYAIFLILAVAPLFWRLNMAWLFLAFIASCAISLHHGALPPFFQLQGAASLLPAFMAGMIAHRFLTRPRSPSPSPTPTLNSNFLLPPSSFPFNFLAFIGRNAWAIMFLDPFFKAVLVAIMPGAASTPVVIILDLLLCASACRLLSLLPLHQLLGVSR